MFSMSEKFAYQFQYSQTFKISWPLIHMQSQPLIKKGAWNMNTQDVLNCSPIKLIILNNNFASTLGGWPNLRFHEPICPRFQAQPITTQHVYLLTTRPLTGPLLASHPGPHPKIPLLYLNFYFYCASYITIILSHSCSSHISSLT